MFTLRGLLVISSEFTSTNSRDINHVISICQWKRSTHTIDLKIIHTVVTHMHGLSITDAVLIPE